jgi:hypothetical protein
MVVHDGYEYLTEEERRLKEDRERTKYWKKWGPYVAERQWATGTMAPIRTQDKGIAMLIVCLQQYERITVLTEMPGAVRTSKSQFLANF